MFLLRGTPPIYKPNSTWAWPLSLGSFITMAHRMYCILSFRLLLYALISSFLIVCNFCLVLIILICGKSCCTPIVYHDVSLGEPINQELDTCIVWYLAGAFPLSYHNIIIAILGINLISIVIVHNKMENGSCFLTDAQKYTMSFLVKYLLSFFSISLGLSMTLYIIELLLYFIACFSIGLESSLSLFQSNNPMQSSSMTFLYYCCWPSCFSKNR